MSPLYAVNAQALGVSPTFKCLKCGGNTHIQVQAVISAPSRLYAQFSKKNLRDAAVQLMGVSWETTDFICDEPTCGHVTDGYGNYVTNLKKEVERLKAKYEPNLSVTDNSKKTR